MASIVAEVAAQIGAIIADPSHKMYGKINKFLGKDFHGIALGTGCIHRRFSEEIRSRNGACLPWFRQ